jgi:hypothetical protein
MAIAFDGDIVEHSPHHSDPGRSVRLARGELELADRDRRRIAGNRQRNASLKRLYPDAKCRREPRGEGGGYAESGAQHSYHCKCPLPPHLAEMLHDIAVVVVDQLFELARHDLRTVPVI